MPLPNVTIRNALESDVTPVTELIHRSFQVWAQAGLRLGPMFQTDAQTSSHLLGKGVVALDQNDKIVGTFSLDDGFIAINSDRNIDFQEGAAITIFQVTAPAEIRSGKYLVFKKLAVCPSIGRSGLGLHFYQMAEKEARSAGYVGVVLETVREAQWLFHWYEKLGFLVIGTNRYPGSPIDTLLMIKNF